MGQKLLINGAGGGVGTFAVQIAQLYGAELTGVDRAAKLEMLRSMGFLDIPEILTPIPVMLTPCMVLAQ